MSRTNWAGNLVYAAKRFVAPKTIAEAQEAVRAADKLRVLGSRHCFNDIADTTGTHLSLEHLNHVVSLDKGRRRVTIEGGVRYGDLGPYLHEQGYALPNYASLPHISVAGACATATHGSGVALGNLATAVAAIEFVNAAGDLVSLSREQDRETFPGAVVSLGALGIVTRLTLDLLPAFNLHQVVYRDLPIQPLTEHFDEIMASGYSVSLFTDWLGDTVEQVWIKSLVDAGPGTAEKQTFFGAPRAAKNMHPLAELDAVNCTEQMGVAGPSHDRLPHFRVGSTPASGNELQVEYFVAKEHAVGAVKALNAFGDRLAPLLLVSEVRTVAADDLWMSPFYKQPSTAFHFSFKPDWPALEKFLPSLEDVLSPFCPRPHWGKLFTMPPKKVRACYERLEDFKRILGTHDPDGKFRNGFVDRNIFGQV
ncbi:FAD-binding protein [soil metagenome]